MARTNLVGIVGSGAGCGGWYQWGVEFPEGDQCSGSCVCVCARVCVCVVEISKLCISY